MYNKKIIDAHLHFRPDMEGFTRLAEAAGHKNEESHLKETYKELGIVCGIVMGNSTVDSQDCSYPEFMRYCVGIDSGCLREMELVNAIAGIEEHLKRPECVGIKLYPGYTHYYITDPVYDPVYELAEKYNKPVAVHMGETTTKGALLKYTHPMTLDEAATKHPGVQFVMCHFGNPWLTDAAAVISKNANVAADISGLLEGRFKLEELREEKKGYIEALKTWMGYLHEYDDIMFGTDWPLVNLEEYIRFVEDIVPEKYHEKVFFENANRIYKLNLE